MVSAVRPAGPKGVPLIGNLWEFRHDPLNFLTRCAQIYGDVAHFMVGPREFFLLNHPDDIKDVLVTSQHHFVKGRGYDRAKHLLGEGLATSSGEFHRRQRRLSQPAFHRQRLTHYASAMTYYTERLCQAWHPGETRDIGQEMMRLTLEIVAKTLFDVEVEAEVHEIDSAFMTSLRRFRNAPSPWAGLIDHLRIFANRHFYEARDRLDSIVYRMIAERRSSGEDRGDLLSMLLQYEEKGDDGASTGERMTDEQVRNEVVTLLFGGYETTAIALAWTWYLLSQHPEQEARLHAEVDSVLGGRLPTIDDIARLPYVEMVFAEAMRLYPPFWIMGRRALQAHAVGRYVIPAGGTAIICQFVTHRDPRFFPEPDRFDPERFTPESRQMRPKFSYYPFGGGSHLCIGESFARTEAILAIATLSQQWRMRLVPGHLVEPEPLLVLRPRYGLPMTLERRG